MVSQQDSLVSSLSLSTSSSPLVSVIIPSYNRCQYLEKAVQSVLEQTCSDLECLIVDDGSTDNTRAVGEYLMSLDERVKYLYKENGGAASARNFGIEHAKGEWIQFLDSDDWLDKDKISFQLNYCNSYDSNKVIFYTDHQRFFEEDGRTEMFYEYDCSSKQQAIDKLLKPWGLQCNGLLLKKSLASIAMFDPKLAYLEDTKFELDLLMQGISFIHTPMIGHFYRVHQSNTSTYCDVSNWKPAHKDAYIKYYESVQSEYKELRKICQQRLLDFLKRTIEQKDKQRFDRILSLLDLPIKLYGFNFRNKSQLRLFQRIIFSIPLQGIYNLVRMFKKLYS